MVSLLKNEILNVVETGANAAANGIDNLIAMGQQLSKNSRSLATRGAFAVMLALTPAAMYAPSAHGQEKGVEFTIGEKQEKSLDTNCVIKGDVRVKLPDGTEVIRPDGNALRGQVVRLRTPAIAIGLGNTDRDETTGGGRCFTNESDATAYAAAKVQEAKTIGCLRQQGCKDGVTDMVVSAGDRPVSIEVIDPRSGNGVYDRHLNPGESMNVDGRTIASLDAVVDGVVIHDDLRTTCDVLDIRGKATIVAPFGGDVHVFDASAGDSIGQYKADLIKEVANECPGGEKGVRVFEIQGKGTQECTCPRPQSLILDIPRAVLANTYTYGRMGDGQGSVRGGSRITV